MLFIKLHGDSEVSPQLNGLRKLRSREGKKYFPRSKELVAELGLVQ